MENLEQFIHNNREAFDTEIPDLRVWAALDRQLNVQTAPKEAKMVSLLSWLPKMRIAASIALLVATGISIGFYLKSNSAAPSLADVSPEHAEMEQFYQKEIEKKERLLVQVANQEAPAVKQDLQAIDQVMVELREELMNAPRGSRAHIIKNMIESYKNKVDILERVLQNRENYSNTNISKQQSNNEKDTI
jgi:hypothetical protein